MMKLFNKKVKYFDNELTVPVWVEWLAMDKLGGLYGYRSEPQCGDKEWFLPDDKRGHIYIAYACTTDNWKTTKQKV